MASSDFINADSGNTLTRFALTAVAAVALVAVSAPNALAQRAANVQVDAVRSEPLSQTVPIIGRFVAREQGAVAAAVGGPLKAIHVHVGDRVQAGQLLAENQWRIASSDVRATPRRAKYAQGALGRRQSIVRNYHR